MTLAATNEALNRGISTDTIEPVLFKVGDLVRVVKEVTEQPGWDNVWTQAMSATVGDGEIYPVVWESSSMGIQLRVGANIFGYPTDSLELANDLVPAEECREETVGQPKSGSEVRPEPPDPAAHYRRGIKVKLTDQDKENGFVMVQLDPYRIALAYGITDHMQFFIIKKGLRMGSAHKNERQELLDIINAANRRIEILDELPGVKS
jgi:hypothetical protein